MNGSLAERFAALFAGRKDVYGTDQGGCARVEPSTDWSWLYDMHLNGVNPIGVYPLVRDLGCSGFIDGKANYWVVKWGCVDIDVKSPTHSRWDYETTEEGLIAARNLVTACAALGWVAWIERTRNGGYHVWTFASEWVPAATMRRAQLVACGLAEVPTSEVNPKSEGSDDPEFLGNYVNLPYPGALNAIDYAETRWVYKEPNVTTHGLHANKEFLPLHDFVLMAERSLASPDVLATAAAYWTEPAKSTVQIERTPATPAAMRRLNGLAFVMLRDGPLDPDRSAFLYQLACECRTSGLNPSEAVAIVREADVKHTQKYVGRRDEQERYEATIRKAYT